MSKKLMLIITPVIILIICCLGALLLIPEGGNTQLYLQQIQQAEKCVETGDYEQAITYYKKAIEADKTQETPYLQIANLYYDLGDIENAIAILRTGVAQSGTDKIKNALQRYLQLDPSSTEPIDDNNISQSIAFNSDLLNRFANYTFEIYTKSYTVENEKYLDGTYTVKYLDIDAEFIYKNNDNGVLIDETKAKPYDHVRPVEIKFNNISLLFNKNVTEVSSEDLRSYGAGSVKTKYISKDKVYLVTFTYANSQIQLECGEDGVIIADSKYNKMFPVPVEEKPTEEKTIATANIDVVFAVDVSGSMSYDIGTAKQAVNSFIDALDEKDRAGLVQFNGFSQILSELTTDKNSLKSKVSSLSTSGGTAIHKGLSDALTVLNKSSNTDENTYKMIIILSDGYDSVSSYESTYSGLINTAVNNNIVVYTVGIGSTVDTNLLTRIAGDTNGGYYHANSASEIIRIFEDIQQEEIVVTNTSSLLINVPNENKKKTYGINLKNNFVNIGTGSIPGFQNSRFVQSKYAKCV